MVHTINIPFPDLLTGMKDIVLQLLEVLPGGSPQWSVLFGDLPPLKATPSSRGSDHPKWLVHVGIEILRTFTPLEITGSHPSSRAPWNGGKAEASVKSATKPDLSLCPVVLFPTVGHCHTCYRHLHHQCPFHSLPPQKHHQWSRGQVQVSGIQKPLKDVVLVLSDLWKQWGNMPVNPSPRHNTRSCVRTAPIRGCKSLVAP